MGDTGIARKRICGSSIGAALMLLGLLVTSVTAWGQSPHLDTDGARDRLQTTIETLSKLGNRSPGAAGNRQAAQFVKMALADLGLESVGSFGFSVPFRRHAGSAIIIPGRGRITTYPFLGNRISPGTLPPEGLSGPLIYAGAGRPQDFNGLPVNGAIVLMELDSGKNWTYAANLGAAAVVYLGRGPADQTRFKDKIELTPIRVPRLWVAVSDLADVLDLPSIGRPQHLAAAATVESTIHWDETVVENVYGWIPGSDSELASEILLVEAFYDSTEFISGLAPGADEASGVAMLIELARYLKRNPPGRSVLFLATGAHNQGLVGMREAVWTLKARSKDLKLAQRHLKTRIARLRKVAETLDAASLLAETPDPVLVQAVSDEIKSLVDEISRWLMRLRLRDAGNPEDTRVLAEERRILRALGWKHTYKRVTPEEKAVLLDLIPVARARHQERLEDARRQAARLDEAMVFRRLAREGEMAAAISLHLSSHGNGIGAFNKGWLHNLKPTINRTPAYSHLADVMNAAARSAAERLSGTIAYRDTLRPSRLRPWQSYLPDQPQLGGEISALAGYHGVSLVTTDDIRPFWGTPYDTADRVNYDGLADQSRLVCGMIFELTQASRLHQGKYPRDGLSTVNGRASFLRQGELFADQPAPSTMVMAFQGKVVYYAKVDSMGRFALNGVADKKHVLDKVILEAYRFDTETGETLWAVDKKQTGKAAYRVKMQRRVMETDLIMFACRETTLLHLLEPRSFRYMTRIQLLDARREAAPLRYWWSRIDSRESILSTLYLEPDTRFKLTLSDTVLKKKLILTGATERRPEGVGYPIDGWPVLYHTEYRVAKDMWALLDPRIHSLESHGIHDERLSRLQKDGTGALQAAAEALENQRYDRFLSEATRSWALASRVYDQVEKTQKDVLFGVLFYIALFVPFAYCAERLLFSYRNIHKRIVAFVLILLLLIFVIYQVHPAFELAYSPSVVILAFFIMGLSLIVTLIIFFRFEEEMVQLQRRATAQSTEDISRWKAFLAAFFLGVSNLRRRRLRTALTCMTLVILTFTIMSFTSVKSSRHQTRVQFQPQAPYQGQLLKNANWTDLPPEAYGMLTTGIQHTELVSPRVWLETSERTWAPRIALSRGARTFDARGLVGLAPEEIDRTGLSQLLVGGRWFKTGESHVVVVSDRIADILGVDLRDADSATIRVWGGPHRVCGIFDSDKLQSHLDLDGEPLTPVTFPNEALTELTDVEFDALESGEDVRSFQSRYQHTAADVTLFMPYRDVLSAGGSLKAVVSFPPEDVDPAAAARRMVERFGVMLFSGESGGTYVYQSSNTIQYKGLPNVFIPMMIAVLIVLNTMIGSVYERQHEIGIYTSVGLAPSHVSFLFIAEALAFAVLSVVMGYLFAQGAAQIFSRTPLWAGITVNYSSLAGVGAMVLVIAVVLISVTYPSRVAARIAIPDINRSWRLPDPKTSTMAFRLPFMVQRGELESVGGFLLDHFRSHQDISHGLFSTGDISVEARNGHRTEPNPLRINSRVWLAPFDFGIMQRVEVLFSSAETEASRFLSIDLRLDREAGEANTWGRVNRQFVNALRKQLLIWRSLDATSAEAYGRLLRTALEETGTPTKTP